MFAHWIKQRIKLYGFVEGEDYVTTVAFSGKRSNVKRTEYLLILDMAKHLAMMERNKQGHAARKYFIEMEKQANEMFDEMQQMVQISRADMFELLAKRERAFTAVQAELEEALPKVDFVDGYTLTISNP